MTPRFVRMLAPSSLLPLAVAVFALLAPPAAAQSIVVMVNDVPITSYDVAQRQRFIALTSGIGNRMRQTMQSAETQQAFREYMRQEQPRSREEAQALQKKFVDQMQRQVVASAARSKRQEAIDQLIDERLMLQAAKERKISISDDKVNQALTQMAKRNSKQKTLKAFLASFRAQGINPMTLKERIRAQLAWRDLIRQLYLPLVRSAVSPDTTTTGSTGGGGTVLDAEIVKLSVSGGGGQRAVAQRLVDAEAIRQGFSSCSKLRSELEGKSGISVQSVRKAKLSDFPGDVRPALSKADSGDMTPPIIKGDRIESVAVCSKTVKKEAPKKKKSRSASDERQEKLQLYAERHLRDLKDRAHLKYPKSG